MTSFRQVSWLAGLNPSPPSRALSARPVATWRRARRRQLRGQLRIWLVPNGQSHRIPFGRSNIRRTWTCAWKKQARFLSTSEIHSVVGWSNFVTVRLILISGAKAYFIKRESPGQRLYARMAMQRPMFALAANALSRLSPW